MRLQYLPNRPAQSILLLKQCCLRQDEGVKHPSAAHSLVHLQSITIVVLLWKAQMPCLAGMIMAWFVCSCSSDHILNLWAAVLLHWNKFPFYKILNIVGKSMVSLSHMGLFNTFQYILEKKMKYYFIAWAKTNTTKTQRMVVTFWASILKEKLVSHLVCLNSLTQPRRETFRGKGNAQILMY